MSDDNQEKFEQMAEAHRIDTAILGEELRLALGDRGAAWLVVEAEKEKKTLFDKFMETDPGDSKTMTIIQMEVLSINWSLKKLIYKINQGQDILKQMDEQEKG